MGYPRVQGRTRARARPGWGCRGRSPHCRRAGALAGRTAGADPLTPALSREGRGGRTALETVAAPSQSPCARWPRRRGGAFGGSGAPLRAAPQATAHGGRGGRSPPQERSPRVGGWARAAQRARPGWGCGGRSPPRRTRGRPRGLIRLRGAERRCAPGPHPRPLPRGEGAGGREDSRSGRPGRQGASGGSIIQRATRGSPSVRRQSSESGSAASRRSAPRIWRRSQRRSHMFVPASASNAWWASR